MTLWDFSLEFYSDARVQEACLTAQDEHGADVNVLLYLLWRAWSREAFGPEAVAAIDAAVEPWRGAAVVPLRAVRRALKGSALLPDVDTQEGFRSRLKKLELGAERCEQDLLEGLAVEAETTAPPRDAAAKSIAAYAGHLGTDFPRPLVTVLLNRLERSIGRP